MKSRTLQPYSDSFKPKNGWLFDALERITVNILPKVVVIAPYNAKPASYYVGKGFGVFMFSGEEGSDPNFTRHGIPFTGSGSFMMVGIVGENPKPVPEWDDTDFMNFGNRVASRNRYNYLTDSIDEGVAANGYNISDLTYPRQWYEAQRAIGIACANRGEGQLNAGSYPPDVRITKVTDQPFLTAARLRGPLTNNQTALSQLRPGGALVNRSGVSWDHPYSAEKKNLFNYKMCLLQRYIGQGVSNGYGPGRLAEYICDSIIARNALNGLLEVGEISVIPKIMSFTWLGNGETLGGRPGEGFHTRYRREVPAGGAATHLIFPTPSYQWQYAMCLFSLIHDDVIFQWQEPEMFGDDPNIVDTSDFQFYYEGAGAARAPAYLNNFDPNDTAKRPYPRKPLGSMNTLPEAARDYGLMNSWTGNQVFVPIQIRKKGETAWQTTGKDSIIDAHLNKSAYIIDSTNLAMTRDAYVIYSFADDITIFEIKFPNGNIAEFNAVPNVAYARIVDHTAT